MPVEETPSSQNEARLRQLYGFTSPSSSDSTAELASISSQSASRSAEDSWKITVQGSPSQAPPLQFQFSDTIPTIADYKSTESNKVAPEESPAKLRQNFQKPQPKASPKPPPKQKHCGPNSKIPTSRIPTSKIPPTNRPFPAFTSIPRHNSKPLQKIYTHPSASFSSGTSYPVWPHVGTRQSNPVFFLEQQQQEAPEEIKRIADLTSQLVALYQNSGSPEDIRELHLRLYLSHQKCLEPCPRPPEVFSMLALYYESNE